MAKFGDTIRKRKERMESPAEAARKAAAESRGKPKPEMKAKPKPKAPAAAKPRTPSKVNKPHTITSGMDERERRLKELEERIKKLQGK